MVYLPSTCSSVCVAYSRAPSLPGSEFISFITNQGWENEEFNPVLVNRQVPDVSPAYVNYDAHLYIWASLDFKESELLDDSVQSTPSLWDGDLGQLTGKKIPIKVYRDKGKVVVDGPKSSSTEQTESVLPTTQSAGSTSTAITYKANLAFATPNLLSVGVKAIVETLLPLGYPFFKATTKGFDTDAELEAVLPQNISCNQAELDLIDAIEANKNIFGKAYIKGPSGNPGVTMLSYGDYISYTSLESQAVSERLLSRSYPV
ncbi:hypothetical protein BN946_scf184807.g3 [Trametes cinnabarina]|uniref:Uncharacterized protein n=1 Tax=Pycnoporus cinnabarinus TaxID=5643 RepID=A0A060SJK3_PYCCI|nr:hypothetical protein BN946_scf184807.g3 [Trametes cinnabarina]